MNKNRITLKAFATLLTVIFVCIGCGKNSQPLKNAHPNLGENEDGMCNPAMRFTEYEPVFGDNAALLFDETGYGIESIKILDKDGEIKYSDEDAEKYYDHYVFHFLLALEIGRAAENEGAEELKSYMEDHLFDIACELPFDESYSNDIFDMIREQKYGETTLQLVRTGLNGIYENCREAVQKMKLHDRGKGYIKYDLGHEAFSDRCKCLSIYRDKESGNLMAGLSRHD